MLGFITPISDRYCDTCSRFRLSSDGKLWPCLAYDRHVDLVVLGQCYGEVNIHEEVLEDADSRRRRSQRAAGR